MAQLAQEPLPAEQVLDLGVRRQAGPHQAAADGLVGRLRLYNGTQQCLHGISDDRIGHEWIERHLVVGAPARVAAQIPDQPRDSSPRRRPLYR
jgi:hypothetical protein